MDIKSNYINREYLCYRTDTYFISIDDALSAAKLELQKDSGCMFVKIYYDDKRMEVCRRINEDGIECDDYIVTTGYTYDYLY